ALIGDYVIVHVGFAISKVDEQAAKESLLMIAQLDLDPTNTRPLP
ncbi:MAG: HypC/HybG/HupF family hydrogenase formation chaperone, partial [Nitrospirota bacterium]